MTTSGGDLPTGPRGPARAGEPLDGEAVGAMHAGTRPTPIRPNVDAPPAEQRTTEEVVEKAVTLYCQGMTIAGVARALDTSQTTVRRWVRRGLALLASDARTERLLELQRMIESQRAVARAAWEAYAAEREALTTAPKDSRAEEARAEAPDRAAETADESDVPLGETPRRASGQGAREPRERVPQGARYLALALAAQREVARLQGLFEKLATPPAPMTLTIVERAAGLENHPPALPGEEPIEEAEEPLEAPDGE